LFPKGPKGAMFVFFSGFTARPRGAGKGAAGGGGATRGLYDRAGAHLIRPGGGGGGGGKKRGGRGKKLCFNWAGRGVPGGSPPAGGSHWAFSQPGPRPGEPTPGGLGWKPKGPGGGTGSLRGEHWFFFGGGGGEPGGGARQKNGPGGGPGKVRGGATGPLGVNVAFCGPHESPHLFRGGGRSGSFGHEGGGRGGPRARPENPRVGGFGGKGGGGRASWVDSPGKISGGHLSVGGERGKKGGGGTWGPGGGEGGGKRGGFFGMVATKKKKPP